MHKKITDKFSQDQKNILHIPDSNEHQLDSIHACLQHAENAMEQAHWEEATKRWVMVREMFPDDWRGYVRAATACIKLKKYDEADDLCRLAMKRIPGSIHAYLQYAENAMVQAHWEEATKRWAMVREMFPDDWRGYARAATACTKLKKYDEADDLCRLAMKCIPDSIHAYRQYAENAMVQAHWDVAAIRWAMMQKIFPDDWFSHVRNAFDCLKLKPCSADMDHHPSRMKQIQSCIQSYIHYVEKTIMLQSREEILGCNFSKSPSAHVVEGGKILFVSSTAFKINYYINIIKFIPSAMMDICIKYPPSNQSILKEYRIEHEILDKNAINCDKYSIILGDYHDICNIERTDIKKIGLIHAVDSAPNTTHKLDLVITSSKNQVSDFCKKALLYDQSILSNSCQKFCEVAYSGPYHFDRFAPANDEEKILLRNKITEKYGFHFEKNKIVIFVLEDEFSIHKQLIYCIDKLSKNRNLVIIFKSFPSINSDLFTDKKNILTINDNTVAPNLFRFASDFILAGYRSGSFISSLMCGLPVIPYYSRIEKNKITNSPFFPFRYAYERFTLSRCLMFSFFIFSEYNFLFDLIDIRRIEKTIFGNDFTSWYTKNIQFIQNLVFGDYYNGEDAAKKAAEYIIEFSSKHTLGDKSTYLYV